ncbi:putative phage protein [Candidatus Hepatincola sp. Av]
MTISNNTAIESIKNTLESNGFNLSNTPVTNVFIEAIVNAILNEVKKGTINTNVTGSSATGGPVTGAGIGTIS